MNKLLVALVAGLFAASVALAQTNAPAMPPTTPATSPTRRSRKWESTDAVGVGTNVAAARGTRRTRTGAAKHVAKPTKAQKQANTKARPRFAMARRGAQAAKNTAVSKETPKQTVHMGTPGHKRPCRRREP